MLNFTSRQKGKGVRLATAATVVVAALLIGLAVVGGCAEEPTSIDLKLVPQPEGGSLAAIALLEDEEGVTVFVPHGGDLYARDYGRASGEPGWSSRPASWPRNPSRPSTTGLNLFDGLKSERAAFNFARHQLFLTHDDKIWTVAVEAFPEHSRLIYSADAGESWFEAPLPPLVASRDEVQASSELAANGADQESPAGTPSTGTASLAAGVPTGAGQGMERTGGSQEQAGSDSFRLMRSGDDLFLTNSQRLWKFSPEVQGVPAGEIKAEMWAPISLEGIEPRSKPSRTRDVTGLPTYVRNYLPATAERPYELITVLQEQLMIYRRPDGAERWILSALLPIVDRQLVDVAEHDAIYLLAPDALYQANSMGERWERLDIRAHFGEAAEFKTMTVISNAQAPAGYVLLLGRADGSIWRSSDSGATWEAVHAIDSDRRAITGLVHSKTRGDLFASTDGNGVLHSTDDGMSWSASNQNLQATRALKLAIGPDNELLMGTDAGLFRLTGEARHGNWLKLHSRATSAILAHPENKRVFSGTLGGSIVAQHPDGQEFVSEAAPLGAVERLFVRPSHLFSTALPATAIVSIRPRPGSQQMFAWSHQLGPLTSNDAGASWRRQRVSDALRMALQGEMISSFVTDQSDRLFVLSRSMQGNRPSQLWRSQNNGETWHAIYHFSEEGTNPRPLRVERELHHPPETLFMVHGTRFAHSADQGTTWTTIAGPWQQGTFTAFGLFGDRAVLVANMKHTSEVFSIERPDQPHPTITQHTLIWPHDELLGKDRVLDVVAHDRTIFLSDVDNLYAGHLPRRKTRLPQGMTVFFTLTALLMMTAASFAFLRHRAKRF